MIGGGGGGGYSNVHWLGVGGDGVVWEGGWGGGGWGGVGRGVGGGDGIPQNENLA